MPFTECSVIQLQSPNAVKVIKMSVTLKITPYFLWWEHKALCVVSTNLSNQNVIKIFVGLHNNRFFLVFSVFLTNKEDSSP